MVLLAFVIRPIANSLFVAAVLAGFIWPLHQWLSQHSFSGRGISAAALVLGVVALLLGPIAAFVAFAIAEGAAGWNFLTEMVRSEGVMGLVERLPPPLPHMTRLLLDRLPATGAADLVGTVQALLRTQGANAAIAVGATLSATGTLLFQTAMMLMAFYFLLLQGDKLVAWLDEVSPLKSGQTLELMAEFKSVSFSVILSTVLTSAAQASAALCGYLIARVPHALFFTGLTFFVAFVPAVGAASVCLLAAVLILATGHGYAALFLALWGLIVVGLIDNVIKPLLIRAGMHMNAAVVFFALIGGLSAFGAIGLLLGPLVVALCLALLRMYKRDFKPET